MGPAAANPLPGSAELHMSAVSHEHATTRPAIDVKASMVQQLCNFEHQNQAFHFGSTCYPHRMPFIVVLELFMKRSIDGAVMRIVNLTQNTQDVESTSGLQHDAQA